MSNFSNKDNKAFDGKTLAYWTREIGYFLPEKMVM